MYTNVNNTSNVNNINTSNVVEERVCNEFSFYRKDVSKEEIAKLESEIEEIEKYTTISKELEEKYSIFIKYANAENSK